MTLAALPSPGPNLFAVWVQVQPRDARGEYLGPFREAELVFQTSAGSFEGEVVSTTDGIYRRRMVYKVGETPVVQVTVAGTPLKPVLTFNPELCITIDELCRHGHACRAHLAGLIEAFAHLKGLFQCTVALKAAIVRVARAFGKGCGCQ